MHKEAKKVAIKDIEFYTEDLKTTIGNKGIENSKIFGSANKAYQIIGSLNLALQLYVISSLSEINYAQNYDLDYLNYLEKEIQWHIDKCDKNISDNLKFLKRDINSCKPDLSPIEKFSKKIDKSKYEEYEKYEKKTNSFIDKHVKGQSTIYKSVESIFKYIKSDKEYVLTDSGDIYIKNHNVYL